MDVSNTAMIKLKDKLYILTLNYNISDKIVFNINL